MEESSCHEMVSHLSQSFSSMLCFCMGFLHFFISSKYDFHVDAERMIVKRENVKKYLRRWLKKCMARYAFRREDIFGLRSTKQILTQDETENTDSVLNRNNSVLDF